MGAEMLKFPGKVRNKHKKMERGKISVIHSGPLHRNPASINRQNYQSDVKGGSQCGNKYN